MTDIFISYKSADRARVHLIATMLQNAGYDVWSDSRLEASGTPYPAQIWEKLIEAKAVIVVWSKHSLDSPWVHGEAEEARKDGKILQVRIDDCRLRPPFNILQTVDLSSWTGGDTPAWAQVFEAVKRLAGDKNQAVFKDRPGATPKGLALRQRSRFQAHSPSRAILFQTGVTAFVWSNDGRLCTLGADKKGAIWTRDGKNICRFPIVNGLGPAAAFNDDSSAVLVSDIYELTLRSTETGEALGHYSQSGEGVFEGVTFQRNVAVALRAKDRDVHTTGIFRLSRVQLSGRALSLEDLTQPVKLTSSRAVAFTSDLSRCFLVNDFGRMLTIDMHSGAQKPIPIEQCNQCFIDSRGTRLVVDVNAAWSVRDREGTPIASLDLGGALRHIAAFSEDAMLVATGSSKGSFALWEAASGRKLGWASTNGKSIDAIAFSKNGRSIAFGDQSGNVEIWDLV
ncbi:MAG: TIR domain-containing protein [Vitreimonas sp.]